MATFSAKVFKHHKRSDGTYNVKIEVSHLKKRKYLDTEHYVSGNKLTKDLKIKDPNINAIINRTLDEYRMVVSELGKKLAHFDVDTLADYILNKEEGIDFLAFCQVHIDGLYAEKRDKSASNYKTVRNSLVDFFQTSSFPIADITVTTLKTYERFLRSPRKMMRRTKQGGMVKIKSRAMSDAGVHCYLRDFSGMFSAAMTYYNKPALGLMPITYNPFSEYTIVDAPITRKRNLTIEQIKTIRDCKARVGSRAELARDMFMLSFYLCGINAKDIYADDYIVHKGRLEYNRSKTKDKRKDDAFISIKIPPEAKDLLKKCRRLSDRYSSIGCLNKALSKGMKDLNVTTRIADFTYYWARHSFGNIARNKCRKSKDDVAMALNHVDFGRKTTDIYLEKDWTIVDEVQDAVLQLLRRLDKIATVPPTCRIIQIWPYIKLPRLMA
jgi:hypothetical protein